MNCPNCDADLTQFVAQQLGQIRTERKAEAARENGKKGGRPKGSKNKPKS